MGATVPTINTIAQTVAKIAADINKAATSAVPAGILDGWSAGLAASVFDNANLTAAKAALIFDHTNLTVTKAKSILQNTNLSSAKRSSICVLKTRLFGVWISGGDLITARDSLAGAGTQTAGLSFGGSDNVGIANVTEHYNGAVWSSGGALATARWYLAGAGSQTAGLSFGGDDPAYSAVTEEYV